MHRGVDADSRSCTFSARHLSTSTRYSPMVDSSWRKRRSISTRSSAVELSPKVALARRPSLVIERWFRRWSHDRLKVACDLQSVVQRLRISLQDTLSQRLVTQRQKKRITSKNFLQVAFFVRKRQRHNATILALHRLQRRTVCAKNCFQLGSETLTLVLVPETFLQQLNHVFRRRSFVKIAKNVCRLTVQTCT